MRTLAVALLTHLISAPLGGSGLLYPVLFGAVSGDGGRPPVL